MRTGDFGINFNKQSFFQVRIIAECRPTDAYLCNYAVTSDITKTTARLSLGPHKISAKEIEVYNIFHQRTENVFNREKKKDTASELTLSGVQYQKTSTP